MPIQTIQAQRNNSLNDVTSTMQTLLSHLLPKDGDAHRAMNAFHKKITTSASEPATDLRLSLAQYFFNPSPLSSAEHVGQDSLQRNIANYIMIIVTTERKCSQSTLLAVQEDGKCGEELCVVHPAHMRRGRRNGMTS